MLENDYYGDRFRWFVGVVKDVGDDKARVKVRIFGIHPTENLIDVSNDDLPWAMVVYPTTAGQTSGGVFSHGLVEGSWVVGFFVDGEDSQQPVVLGSINGGPGSTNLSPPDPITVQQSMMFSTSTSNPGQTAISNPNQVQTLSPTTTSSSQLSGSDNRSKSYNFFWEKIAAQGNVTGDRKCIVAAIIGNLMVESGSDGINPQAYNGNDKGEPAYGIAQWRGGKYDRATPFFKFCGYSNVTLPPNLPPLEQQLDFIWQEFNSTEKHAFNNLLTQTNIQDAVAAIIGYERDQSYNPKTGVVDRTNSSYLTKLAKARGVLSTMSYTGTLGTPTS